MWLVLPRGLRHDWSNSLTRLLFIPISSLPSKKSPSRPSSALRRSPSRPFIPGKLSSVHSLAKRSCPSDLVLSLVFINSGLEISNLHFSSWNHRSRRPGLGFLRISPRIWYRSVLFFKGYEIDLMADKRIPLRFLLVSICLVFKICASDSVSLMFCYCFGGICTDFSLLIVRFHLIFSCFTSLSTNLSMADGSCRIKRSTKVNSRSELLLCISCLVDHLIWFAVVCRKYEWILLLIVKGLIDDGSALILDRSMKNWNSGKKFWNIWVCDWFCLWFQKIQKREMLDD